MKVSKTEKNLVKVTVKLEEVQTPREVKVLQVRTVRYETGVPDQETAINRQQAHPVNKVVNKVTEIPLKLSRWVAARGMDEIAAKTIPP